MEPPDAAKLRPLARTEVGKICCLTPKKGEGVSPVLDSNMSIREKNDVLTSVLYTHAAGPRPRLYPMAYMNMNAMQMMSATLFSFPGYTMGKRPFT